MVCLYCRADVRGDHVDALDLGEVRGDRIRHAVGEVVLRRIPRQVLERQHDEGPDRFCGCRRARDKSSPRV